MLKDITVHVDAGRASAARVDVACALAKAQGARLVGVFVITPPDIPPYLESQVGNEVIEAQYESARAEAQNAKAYFEKTASGLGIEHEWRITEGITADVLAQHVRYSDMIVVGQNDPDERLFTGGGAMPDELIMGAGRPVLVVPYVGSYPTVGSHVMVAWDASVQAARAVKDSLDILRQAQRVSVMVINPDNNAAGGNPLPGADLATYLARHGITVDAQHINSSDIDPANMLLSRAADEGIDLMVMGAYGHARWREIVMGGVTREFLLHMTMPVLMAH